MRNITRVQPKTICIISKRTELPYYDLVHYIPTQCETESYNKTIMGRRQTITNQKKEDRMKLL
jgi:hypothetical protein